MGLRDTESRGNTEQDDKLDCQRNTGLFSDLVYLLPLHLGSPSTVKRAQVHWHQGKGLHGPQDPTLPGNSDLFPLLRLLPSTIWGDVSV